MLNYPFDILGSNTAIVRALEIMDRETLAKALKALGDPTRLSIFDILLEGVQCNCEIAERLKLSLSLVSPHLRALRQVGLVQGERDSEDARWIYYSIDREELSQLGQAMKHLLDVTRIRPRVPSCGPRKCDSC
jgi:ArsR family transcriptional regulator